MINLRIITTIAAMAAIPFFLFLFSPLPVLAQTLVPPDQLPQGESVTGTWHIHSGLSSANVCATAVAIYYADLHSGTPTLDKIWSPPSGQIVTITAKDSTTLVCATGTSILELTINPDTTPAAMVSKVNDVTGSGIDPSQIAHMTAGAALFAQMNSGQLYEQADGIHWDSTGLSSNTSLGISLPIAFDADGNTYIAGGQDLLEEPKGTNGWQMVSTVPESFGFAYLFITEDNRLLGAGSNLWVSTDQGKDWEPDTAGLGASNTNIHWITEDSVQNLYAHGYGSDGEHLWKQTPGGMWNRVDGGTSLYGLSANGAYFINNFTVDSGIFLATYFGELYSSDGTNWTPVEQGNPAANIYYFFKHPDGTKIASTRLGIYKFGPSDTGWTKRFPLNSFVSGRPVFEDNSGNLYTPGIRSYITLFDVYVSTDKGSTWLPDTIGNAAFAASHSSSIDDYGAFDEFVDELGNSHMAANGSVVGDMQIFTRQRGGVWVGDSAGYFPDANQSDIPGNFFSDLHGTIYLTIINGGSGLVTQRVLKRSILGGAWSDLTTNPSIGVPGVLVATKDGKLIGGGYSMSSLAYFDGSSWSVIPNPPGLSNVNGFPMSVDSSNRLWAEYSHVTLSPYSYTSYGLYWTLDLGQHWTHPADTLDFGSMASFGDTTYGFFDGAGITYFVPGSAGVTEPPNPDVVISIMPNPSVGNVMIKANGARNFRSEIYDILGNLVWFSDGNSAVNWNGRIVNGSAASAGVYIVRVSGIDAQGKEFLECQNRSIE